MCCAVDLEEFLVRRAGGLGEGVRAWQAFGLDPDQCGGGWARPIIQKVLPAFLAAYPDIHVEIVVDTRFVDIVADGFDAGIRIRDDVPCDMTVIPFGPDWRFVAVASPDYLVGREPPRTPQDLPRHRCIRFRFASGALYPWDLQCGDRIATVEVQGPMTLGNTNLMLEAALNGIGIAWLPESLVTEHLAQDRLVRVLPEWSHGFPGACLYYPANRHPPTALSLFAQAVRDWNDGSQTHRTITPTRSSPAACS